VIYTMMFGYPIPTDDSPQFDNQTACQIYLHTRYSDAVVDAFQPVCSRDTNEFDKQTACQIYLHTSIQTAFKLVCSRK
jgi:hypothetical protein